LTIRQIRILLIGVGIFVAAAIAEPGCWVSNWCLAMRTSVNKFCAAEYAVQVFFLEVREVPAFWTEPISLQDIFRIHTNPPETLKPFSVVPTSSSQLTI